MNKKTTLWLFFIYFDLAILYNNSQKGGDTVESIYNVMPKTQLLTNEEVTKLYTDEGVASSKLEERLSELQARYDELNEDKLIGILFGFSSNEPEEEEISDDVESEINPFHSVSITSEMEKYNPFEDDYIFEFDDSFEESDYDIEDSFHGVSIENEMDRYSSYEEELIPSDEYFAENDLIPLNVEEHKNNDDGLSFCEDDIDFDEFYSEEYEMEAEKKALSEEINNIRKQLKDPIKFKREYRVYPSKELEHKVCNAYLYLVRMIASEFSRSSDLSYDDAFQIGSLGLLSACHYYVPGGPATFKTYASDCIINSLKKSLKKNPTKKKKYTLFDEIERIEYFEKYLESFIYFDKKRKTFDVRDDYYRVIRNRFGLYTKSHNHKMYLTGNNHLIFRKTTGKDYDLSEFLKEILSGSSMKYFITDEDREAFKVYLDYKHIPNDKKKFFMFYELIGKYLRQLKMCKEYIEVYDELQKKNPCEIPNDDKIFKVMNDRIREKKKQRPFYKDLTSFYHVYLDKFNVDMLLKDEDSNYPNSGDMSRHQEIAEIEGWYDEYLNEVEEHLNYIQRKFNEIESYYFDNEEDIKSGELDSKFISTWDEYTECINSSVMVCDSDSELLNNGDLLLFNLILDEQCGKIDYETARKRYEDYIKKLTEYIDFLKSNKDMMVGRMLKKRSDEVNSIITAENAPKIEINKKIYEVASRLGKVLRKHDFKECTKALNIMYADEVFLDTMPKESGYNPEFTLEEEAIDNLFMEDYKEACSELTDIQREILSYWFDSMGRHSYSAKEISEKLGISQSEVSKEKNKALTKLRKNKLMLKHLNN